MAVRQDTASACVAIARGHHRRNRGGPDVILGVGKGAGLRALQEATAPKTVTEDTRNVFEADWRDAKELRMDGIELLETLHLLPDEPLPIRGE